MTRNKQGADERVVDQADRPGELNARLSGGQSSGAGVTGQPRGTASGFTSGVIWNLGSLAFLALAGFVLNIIIGRIYGPEALGVFNIAFALYILLSQLGSFGLHFSVLQAISANAGRDQGAVDAAASQGLIVATIIAAAATLIGLAGTPLLSNVFDAPDLTMAWLLILPGLFFFSINKLLFAVINGARHMRTFAVLQACRYVLILVVLFVLIWRGAPASWLTLTLTLAELALAPLLLFYASHVTTAWPWRDQLGWRRRHLSFGGRVFLSGAILELNTRVDVLMIGFFLDAAKAGIYSVALLIAEGVFQLVFVLRNNINPLLARFAADGDVSGLLKLSRKTVLIMTPAMLVVASLGWLLFPVFEWIAFGSTEFAEARGPLLALLLGLAVSSGFLIFNMLLSQAEKPGLHSAYVGAVLIANAVLNVVFINTLGIVGAAVATSLSYAFSAVLLVVLARRVLGLRLVV